MAEKKKEFKPVKNYKIVYQAYNQSVEELYFWFVGWFKDDLRGTNTVEKITDVFSASESSSFFGAQQMRLGAQQDKAAQYLRGISEMAKQLFQIVREVRILNERLTYYETSMSNDPDAESAEISLKGIYVDLVEGAGKNPSSVYGLAQQVGFSLLPDLFFRTKVDVHKGASIRKAVQALEFNEKVKEVLERKLTQFYSWKEATFKEMSHTRQFRIKYLKSYYHTIMLYLQWVKPYLKHVKRLTMKEGKTDTAELIAGMEQAMLEIEILVKFNKVGDKVGGYTPVLDLHFNYRTAPRMDFQDRDTYQKGPIHVGRTEIEFRGYVLSDKELEEFKRSKQEEDFELLGAINESIKETLDSLGDDLKQYLVSEGEEPYKPKKEKEEEPEFSIMSKAIRSLFGKPKDKKKSDLKGTFEIFYLPFKGLGDLFDSMTGISKFGVPKNKKGDVWKESKDKKKAAASLKGMMWTTYNVFKKAHGMVTW